MTDLRNVVSAYAFRWRVEDFYKTWKSSACNIETSQLESRETLLRWITSWHRSQHASNTSNTPPGPLLKPLRLTSSRDEIDATTLLYKAGLSRSTIPYRPGDTPPVAELIRWIASLGGHMGNVKSRPPGTRVIRRGLDYVASAAQALAAQRAEKKR